MSKLTRKQFLKKCCLALSSIAFVDSFWYERDVIDWTSHDIACRPENKIKIIQLSDLHLTRMRYIHKPIASNINKIMPDIVFFTGDTITHSKNLEILSEFLKLIEHSIPKYAIVGNREHWGGVNFQKLSKVYQNNNCKLLINQNDTLMVKNRTVAIIGVDDLVGGVANYNKAASNLAQS